MAVLAAGDAGPSARPSGASCAPALGDWKEETMKTKRAFLTDEQRQKLIENIEENERKLQTETDPVWRNVLEVELALWRGWLREASE